jgi:HEAT repeat protein
VRGLLWLLLAAAQAAAPTGRAGVEAHLRAGAFQATTPQDWRALGPGTDRTLCDVARDSKADPLIRSRAVSALAYFPTATSRKLLEETIEKKASSRDPDDRLLVRKAAVALGWIGGTATPLRLAPLLEHPDPDVRIDAAVGLGLTRMASAADPLRKRFDVESEPRVRAQIGRQLRLIEDALVKNTPSPADGKGAGGK